jgi:hypothetical protein
LFFALLHNPVQAGQSVSLAWGPSVDPSVVGYNIYDGVASQTYTNKISAGNVTSVTISNLVEGTTYYFVVTAYNAVGLESPPSNEVSYFVPLSVVNQPPTLNPIGSVTVNENAGLQTVNLSGISSGAINEAQILTVTASSSNPGLIPTPAVTYTSPNAAGSLRFTPVANGFGSAVITVKVNDGGVSNNIVTRTFTVTVNAVNQAPTLNALGSVTVNENAALQAVNLSGISSGATNEVQTLTVTASSSNSGLIPTPAVSYTSPATTGSLTFTPSANGFGSAVITVRVNDGGTSNNIVTQIFTVTVNNTAQAPRVQIRVAPNSQVVLTVTGQVGSTYNIQASPDLTTWTVIGAVLLPAGGSLDFTDTNAASFPKRFYRTH